jgi:hypothetical protein
MDALLESISKIDNLNKTNVAVKAINALPDSPDKEEVINLLAKKLLSVIATEHKDSSLMAKVFQTLG